MFLNGPNNQTRFSRYSHVKNRHNVEIPTYNHLEKILEKLRK